jgi:histidine phosphotransferase ChpT
MDQLRLAQLLCSRICHDIITPVSAINNGFELLGPSLTKVDEEMSFLIQKSAQNAAQRLMIVRAGFSYGGQHLLSSFEKTAQLLESFLSSHKIHFHWSDLATAQKLIDLMDQPLWGRILVNVATVLTEGAPKGGALCLTINEETDLIAAQISFKGNLIELKSDIISALVGSLAEKDVTAHTVLSYLTYIFMENIPLKLKFLKNDLQEILINIQSHTHSLQKSGTLF